MDLVEKGLVGLVLKVVVLVVWQGSFAKSPKVNWAL